MNRLGRLLGKYWDGVRNLHPPSERVLFTFNTAEDLAKWETFTDAVFGGKTTAALEKTTAEGAVGAAFSGHMSLEVDESAAAAFGPAQIRRSGFCGMRTKAGLPEMDLEPFDTLAFRVKGDGRKYIASLRTDAWVDMPGANHDLWQTFLFAPPGAWADVHIPLSRFLKTWRGKVLDHHHEMRAEKVLSLTISLAGGGTVEPPGPFRLELGRIWALNAQRLGVQLPLVTLVSEERVALGAPSPAMEQQGGAAISASGEGDSASASGEERRGEQEEGAEAAEPSGGAPLGAQGPQQQERRPGDSAPRVGAVRGVGSNNRGGAPPGRFGGGGDGARGYSTAAAAAAGVRGAAGGAAAVLLPQAAAARSRHCGDAAAPGLCWEQPRQREAWRVTSAGGAAGGSAGSSSPTS